jgi:hypothetical protein
MSVYSCTETVLLLIPHRGLEHLFCCLEYEQGRVVINFQCLTRRLADRARHLVPINLHRLPSAAF